MIQREKLPLLPCIQLLRTLAAFGVMLSHVGFGSSYATQISFSAGVNLFFCISGFLMMYTTQNAAPEHFIKKRLIRLVPLYWILTLGTFFASIFISEFGEVDNSFDSLIKSLFFIPYSRAGLKTASVIRPIVGPAWTLRFDVWFLFIFAISMKINHKWRGLFSGIVCAALLIVGQLLPDEWAIAYFFEKEFWLNYIAGIIIFYIWKWAENKSKWKKKTFGLWITVAIVSFVLLFRGNNPIILCVVLSFAILLSMLLAIGQKQMPKCILWFGKISYSFYLTHYYVILIIGLFINFNEFSLLTCLGTVIALAVSLVVAYISYYLIEQKIGGFLNRFINKFLKI